MGAINKTEFENIVGIISNEQKEKAEIKEEREAGFSSDEVGYLQAKETLRKSKIQNDLLEETLAKQKQDRGQRKDYASMIFNFMSLYMLGVFFVLVMSGIGCNDFNVSDSVLITLLGTTTATVIGVFNFVARYLFHNKDR